MRGPLVRFALATLAVGAVVGFTGCASMEEKPEAPRDVLIVDKLEILKDGVEWSLKLDAGTYKVELTASGDGAAIKWVGTACPGSGPQAVNTFSTICEMAGTGQLLVSNPSAFGMGQSVSVTIKVTKLARA